MDSFKFGRNCINAAQMESLYNNEKFGGSLIENNPRVINQNPLKQIIMHAPNFGIYSLKHVKASPKTFYDIDILMTEKVSVLDKFILDSTN